MTRREPGALVSLNIKIGVAIILLFLGIILCGLYIKYNQIREELTFISAIIGGLAMVYSSYYLSLTLRENIRREKLRRAFYFTEKLNSIDRAGIRVFIEKELHGGEIPPADFHEKIISDRDLHSAIKSLLGLFEDISIAIQYDYIDEEATYQSLAFLIPFIYQTFLPFIKEERRRFERPSLFYELEKLAGSWKLKKSLLTGKQLPEIKYE